MTDPMIFFTTLLGAVAAIALLAWRTTDERPLLYCALTTPILWVWAYSLFGA